MVLPVPPDSRRPKLRLDPSGVSPVEAAGVHLLDQHPLGVPHATASRGLPGRPVF